RRRLAHRHGLLGAEAGGRRRGAELRLLEQRNFLRRRQQDARPRERGRDLLPARGERQRRRADRDGHERGAAQTMNHRNLAKPKRTVRIPAHASRTLNLPNGESVALGCSVTDPVENVSTSCPMAGFLSGSIGRPMNVAMSFARWTSSMPNGNLVKLYLSYAPHVWPAGVLTSPPHAPGANGSGARPARFAVSSTWFSFWIACRSCSTIPSLRYARFNGTAAAGHS